MGTTARATRPFFGASRKDGGCAFVEESIEFEWHKGISWQVRQRSSESMAQAIAERYAPSLSREDILEVSTASADYETGQALSALNLVWEDPATGESHPVENWFQAAKAYSRAGKSIGPFHELLGVSKPGRYLNLNLDKKTLEQYENDSLFWEIRDSLAGATLSSFMLRGEEFPIVPRSCFYDFLYVSALSQSQNARLAERLTGYRVFTDIMFNPGSGKARKYNTQARSCAIFASLSRRGLVGQALYDTSCFIRAVGYPEESDTRQGPRIIQQSIFDG